MNEWIQVEVGRRRIVRAAPDRKASQSPHSASFFPFPSPPSFTSFFFLPSPPPSMKGCYSSLLPWQSTSQRSLVLGDIMNERMNKLKKKNCLLNIFKNLINYCTTYLLAFPFAKTSQVFFFYVSFLKIISKSLSN